MSEVDYERYLIDKPIYEVLPGIKNRQSPVMTLMSSKQVSGINYYLHLGWIYNIPDPNPCMSEQIHSFDKIILYCGSDYKNPEDLGGEIEFRFAGQPFTFNTSTAIYIPKGIKHGPMIWKKVTRTHMELTLLLNTGRIDKEETDNRANTLGEVTSDEKTDINYEQYIVRKPVYEVVAENPVKGRMHPSMTFMNNDLVPDSNTYIEYNWLWDMPDPDPHIFEHVHADYDEIVLHIGSNPEEPEDLGAEIHIHVNGQPLRLKKTSALYVPKGIKHGPLKWQRVSRPHIEMAIILGAGTLAESDPGGHRKD